MTLYFDETMFEEYSAGWAMDYNKWKATNVLDILRIMPNYNLKYYIFIEKN